MPRRIKNPVVYLALSPAATATALGIKAQRIYDAVDSGALPVYCIGPRRKILVSDTERWVRSHERATKRKRKVPSNG
jgi:hypothetical protein